MAPCFAAIMMPNPPPPPNCFFHRQADSHYASNLNDKLYSVLKIEDMEYPAYLLGYAYGGGTFTRLRDITLAHKNPDFFG
jgi:hypothetical protein